MKGLSTHDAVAFAETDKGKSIEIKDAEVKVSYDIISALSQKTTWPFLQVASVPHYGTVGYMCARAFGGRVGDRPT